MNRQKDENDYGYDDTSATNRNHNMHKSLHGKIKGNLSHDLISTSSAHVNLTGQSFKKTSLGSRRSWQRGKNDDESSVLSVNGVDTYLSRFGKLLFLF